MTSPCGRGTSAVGYLSHSGRESATIELPPMLIGCGRYVRRSCLASGSVNNWVWAGRVCPIMLAALARLRVSVRNA
jgi:hypothetical protein